MPRRRPPGPLTLAIVVVALEAGVLLLLAGV